MLNGWANAIISLGASSDANQQALTLYREALRLKPDYFVARYNIMQALTNTGQEEKVVSTGESLLEAAGGTAGQSR